VKYPQRSQEVAMDTKSEASPEVRSGAMAGAYEISIVWMASQLWPPKVPRAMGSSGAGGFYSRCCHG